MEVSSMIFFALAAFAAMAGAYHFGIEAGIAQTEESVGRVRTELAKTKGFLAGARQARIAAEKRASSCIAEARFWKRTARNLGWVKVPSGAHAKPPASERGAEIVPAAIIPANDA